MNKAIRTTLVDRVINYFDPKAGADRLARRAMVQFYEDQGYIAPGSTKRSMRGYNPSANSADIDVTVKGAALRAASRDMYYNTALARGAVTRMVSNTVGSGLQLQSRIRYKMLGMTKEQAAEWQRNVEFEFNTWASSPECDAERTLNFYDLTNLAFRSILLSGDVFVMCPWIPRVGQIYDTRIRLIEADECINPLGAVESDRVAGGIERDATGAPVRYHFRKKLNRSMLDLGTTGIDLTVPIAAYNRIGMKQVYHLMLKERPMQRRGVPLIAPLIEPLKSIGRYSKAELDAAILNAMFTVFIKKDTPEIGEFGLEAGFQPNPTGDTGHSGESIVSSSNPDVDRVYEMGSATVNEMQVGESIELADPKHPISTYDKYTSAVFKEIGSALEIPFEVLLLHFGSSYSASRAALNEAYKVFMQRRTLMGRYLCQPVYTNWMMEAVVKGRIKAPGFLEDPTIRAAWLNSAWAGPGRGMIDPHQEVKGAGEAINQRLSSYEDKYVEINGGDWNDMVERLADERETLQLLGLGPTEDARSQEEASESAESREPVNPTEGENE